MTSGDLAGRCARLAWIVPCLIPAQLLFSARLSNEKTTASIGNGFRVALTNARAQVATMSIAPGDAEGSPKNRHRAVDQWLYVLSGTGTALVNGKRSALKAARCFSSSARIGTRSNAPGEHCLEP